MAKLYRTLITAEHDAEFFLGNEIDKKYSKVCLKSVFIQHENDANKLFVFGNIGDKLVQKPIFVHCSLLNKSDNFINNEPSDVIATLYRESQRNQKNMLIQFYNNSSKLIMHTTSIRMSLTSDENESIINKGKCKIYYELEFS